MEWLNYHHLLYFFITAREGGVTRASEVLHLSHPTISGQIRMLERSLGEKLFKKKGRGLELTEVGRHVFHYAEEIFTLGRELQESVKGRPTGQPVRLVVGVADVVPKLIVRRLLEPALARIQDLRLVVRDDKSAALIAAIASFEVDVVITDAPLPPGSLVRAFNHELGSSATALYAAPSLARSLRRRFPKALDGAPFLLPTSGTQLRRSLDQWLDRHGIRPKVVAEIEDSALLKTFGKDGLGVFPAPIAIEKEIADRYRCVRVGLLDGVRERFFAISPEKRLKNEGVVAVLEAARGELFSS